MSLNREICFVGKYPGIHLLHKGGCVCMKGHLFSTPGPFIFWKQGREWFQPFEDPGVSQGVKEHFAPTKWRKQGTQQPP